MNDHKELQNIYESVLRESSVRTAEDSGMDEEFEFEAADGTYYVASYDYDAAARHTSYGSNSYDPPETNYDIEITIDAIYIVDEEGERKMVYKNDPQQSIKTYPHEIRVVYGAIKEAIEDHIIENRLDEWN